MEVEFLSRFNKDIENVEPRVKKAILKVIAEAEHRKSLAGIRNCKKLYGHKDAYRIRIGD